ncbi:MAG: DNA repair protein RecO [Peptococcaceae bacterium]|jgi:DNA repair protein RecO (recombination protein O)|nr:DNA repair protein RecO [Peptococcaceae bacterium]MDH7524553.1 DNA repair protein RecO [Peptococcaceae bacterium]
MVALYHTEALVLRARKYMEADSLLTLLTREKGKVSAIAKGVRKPNSRLRGGVQAFTHNDMLLYEGRNLDVVTQSQCLEAFVLLHEDMSAMAAASYWSELLDAMIEEGEKDQELFNLALSGFHALCLLPRKLTVRGLEIKLLSRLGYTPCLEKCVSCGCPAGGASHVLFAPQLGGILCRECSQAKPAVKQCCFSNEALAVWQQLLRMDLSKIGRLKLSAQGLGVLGQAVDEFLALLLERPLKSAPVLKEMMREAD